MKILLKKNVDKLGSEGEIVEVKDGYARNYLIPQGMARMATEGVVKAYREERRQQARKRAHVQEEAERVAEELGDLDLTVRAKVGEGDRIFGSVTTQQVAVELAKHGFEIDRRDIELVEDIRNLGTYHAEVDLHKEVTGKLTIHVEPEEEES
ncbi:MAG: 50S ribosomal protein L9 [Bacteroidetes bacterium QS_8_64_10]|nr:MAG: 50S ribosomal protein L9 [Bacteroidetes bacterium QS_8_64_10]